MKLNFQRTYSLCDCEIKKLRKSRMCNAMSDCCPTETFYIDGTHEHHRKWGLLQKRFQFYLLCKYTFEIKNNN